MMLLNIAIAIALIVIVYHVTKSSITDTIRCKFENEFKDREESLSLKESELERRKILIEKKEEEITAYRENSNQVIKDYYDGTMKRLEKYIEERCESYPYLAGLMADFLTLHYEKSAHLLESKQRPAYMEAYRIRELRAETQKIIVEKKQLEYKLAYIQQMFPNIDDIFDSGFTEEQDFQLGTDENTDRVRRYLSTDDNNTSETELKNLNQKLKNAQNELDRKSDELNNLHSELAKYIEREKTDNQSEDNKRIIKDNEALTEKNNELEKKISDCEKKIGELNNASDIIQTSKEQQETLKKLDNQLRQKYRDCILAVGKIQSFDDCFGPTPLEYKLKRIVKLTDEADISDIVYEAKAHVKSSDGKSVYDTTLRDCTCEDFMYGEKNPCKHMYRLALELGILPIMLREMYPNIKKEISDLRFQYDRTSKALAEKKQLETKLKKREKSMKELSKKLQEEQSQRYPWLAARIAEWRSEALDVTVRDKADKSQMQTLLRKAEAENKMLMNQISFYEYIFPALEDFRTMPPSEAINAAKNESGELPYLWVSEEEYKELSIPEKQQLWLDKYFNKRSKNSWEAGIKYERYIGYLCEKEGYSVKYSGAKLGLNDMGRDLIVNKGKTTYVIQCKRYKEGKETHENHIFQLFGSIVHYKKDAGDDKSVVGVFVTTSVLSPIARECADYLKIKVFENVPFKKYPLIKCNISRDGEKIYHLPFDQQYDNVCISFSQQEKYVSTVGEAESNGFRHAWKHSFNKQN